MKYQRTLTFTSLVLPGTVVAQQAIDHGNGAMQIFDSQGMANSPTWVMVWIGFMMLSFLASLLFVKNHVEARWVMGGFIAGAIMMSAGRHAFGIPMYSGYIALMHVIAWTPALIVLLMNRPFLGDKTAFSIWSGIMTLVILFSFVFDIRDAAIFLSHSLS